MLPHRPCQVDGQYFATTFFNQTVDITEAPKMVDTDLLWLIGTLLLLLGVGGGCLSAWGRAAGSMAGGAEQHGGRG